ncbi:MAG: FkbM family methyltransferase [Planctomycetales bacterium]|nr:FkbM family methyltransferase [Planctomycetales bacterium]
MKLKHRRMRDLLLYAIGLQRNYWPRVTVEQPELRLRDLLPGLIANELWGRSPDEFRFIQIGAFDGNDMLHDTICRFGLRGALVEPQPVVFEKLQETYADQPQLQFVNAAIAHRPGKITMYTQRSRLSSLCSFDPEHLKKHSVPASDIVEVEVDAITFSELLERTGIAQPNLLQVDAEGFDYEILKMVDYRALQPAIVRYEQHHMTKPQRNEIAEMLAALGYQLFAERMDVLAYRSPAASR